MMKWFTQNLFTAYVWIVYGVETVWKRIRKENNVED